MKIVTFAKGLNWHSETSGGRSVSVDDFVSDIEAGHSIDEDILTELSESLTKKIKTLQGNANDKFNNIAGFDFEAYAAIELHKCLRSSLNLSPIVIQDRRFWIWLSIIHFRQLIEIRHPCQESLLSRKGNYGLSAPWEGLLFRLWSRGEYGFDPRFNNNDPYYHAQLGSGDMWRSHILRVDHGCCKEVSRAFLRECYDAKTSLEVVPVSVPIVRELAKRLRGKHALSMLEYYSQDDAVALVRAEMKVAKAKIQSKNGQ
jgi:hypothetical protein